MNASKPCTVNGKPAAATTYGPKLVVRWDGAVAVKTLTATTTFTTAPALGLPATSTAVLKVATAADLAALPDVLDDAKLASLGFTVAKRA